MRTSTIEQLPTGALSMVLNYALELDEDEYQPDRVIRTKLFKIQGICTRFNSLAKDVHFSNNDHLAEIATVLCARDGIIIAGMPPGTYISGMSPCPPPKSRKHPSILHGTARETPLFYAHVKHLAFEIGPYWPGFPGQLQTIATSMTFIASHCLSLVDVTIYRDGAAKAAADDVVRNMEAAVENINAAGKGCGNVQLLFTASRADRRKSKTC